MMMKSETECHLAMPIKQIEQEGLLGTKRYVYSKTVTPTGGYGVVTGVTVGCTRR
jgi:hypothetical protein